MDAASAFNKIHDCLYHGKIPVEQIREEIEWIEKNHEKFVEYILTDFINVSTIDNKMTVIGCMFSSLKEHGVLAKKFWIAGVNRIRPNPSLHNKTEGNLVEMLYKVFCLQNNMEIKIEQRFVIEE